jgi:4-diphosphocytidyl-2-C-methyl-D-erythritol kinase
LALVDGLTFELTPGEADELELTVEYSTGVEPLDVEPEGNLVWRAVRAMQEACVGKPEDASKLASAAGLSPQNTAAAAAHPLGGHMHIHLYKNIPAQAGLGGASSDAAAAIMGLSLLWGVPRLDARCLAVARGLGADVSFFLYSGCAHMAGDGSTMIAALPVPGLNLVLVKPREGVTTRAAYERFDAAPEPAAPIDSLLSCLRSASSDADKPAAVAAAIANNLEPAALALCPSIAQVQRELAAQPGVLRAMLTGSGSVVYGVCADAMSALMATMHFREQGLWAVSTKTQ